jgi:hypothetical protein
LRVLHKYLSSVTLTLSNVTLTLSHLQASCAPLTSTEVKDVETSLAGLRSEKHKAEQAEAAVSQCDQCDIIV